MNWREGTKEKRDEIEATYPDRTFGQVSVSRAIDFVHEGSGEFAWQKDIVAVKDLGWTLSMPHQCDEFEIGGTKDAQQLISDLQEAVKYCSSFDEPKESKP